jgi:hypothetical protein
MMDNKTTFGYEKENFVLEQGAPTKLLGQLSRAYESSVRIIKATETLALSSLIKTLKKLPKKQTPEKAA